MMTIDEYIEQAPSERKPALNRIRAICQKQLVEFEDGIEYGVPCYKKNGVVEIAFANQKNNIALYILKKPVLDKYRHHFPKSYVGKGCIRYPNPEKIDFDLIEQMILESFNSDAKIC